MNFDIKTVKHAKDYIDCLAKGINPLTNEMINDDETINNVKISRCLFYVSDILGEVISNNGVKKAKKKPQEDFDVRCINIDDFNYSPVPISISIIAKEINRLKPENMKKLKVTAITNWLVDIDMLSIVQVNNKNHKRPTENGKNMGITTEQRNGQYGPYYAVLYNESVQHFIIDNIDSIIDGGYNK